MSETNPEGEQQSPSTPEALPEENTGSGKYAAYDKTYLRYVGGVHDTKTKARNAAKAEGVAGSDRVEVREV